MLTESLKGRDEMHHETLEGKYKIPSNCQIVMMCDDNTSEMLLIKAQTDIVEQLHWTSNEIEDMEVYSSIHVCNITCQSHGILKNGSKDIAVPPIFFQATSIHSGTGLVGI
jgi:hypothetical protein